MGKIYIIGKCFASKKFECGRTNLNSNNKNDESLEKRKEELKAFAIVHADNEFELCKQELIPIYEEYDKRNSQGEEKTFQMLPRRFASNLLKIEGNAMFPEDQFTESEKKALETFTKKRYIKSAKVAGRTVYFELDSKIRKYLINILRQRNS